MNKFVEEGRCPGCGGELRVKFWRGSDYVCCGKCRRVYDVRIDHIFTGLYYTGEILDLNDDSQKLSPADFYDTKMRRRQYYPAAPTEPTATLVRACELLAEVVTAEDTSDWDSKVAGFLDGIAKNEPGTYDAAMDRILARAALSATEKEYRDMIRRFVVYLERPKAPCPLSNHADDCDCVRCSLRAEAQALIGGEA